MCRTRKAEEQKAEEDTDAERATGGICGTSTYSVWLKHFKPKITLERVARHSSIQTASLIFTKIILTLGLTKCKLRQAVPSGGGVERARRPVESPHKTYNVNMTSFTSGEFINETFFFLFKATNSLVYPWE